MHRSTCFALLLQASLLLPEYFLVIHALPLESQPPVTASHPHVLAALPSRTRRKVPESVDTSSPVEYMTRLRESLTDSNGRPRTDEEDPTNVWCLLDKDLLDEVYRPRLPNGGKCRAVHQFRFSMRALSEFLTRETVTIQKGILRTYMDTIPRYFRTKTTIPVHISGTFNIIRNNISQAVFGGQRDLNVSANSSGWLELNMTEGLKAIHDQSIFGVSPDIELTLTITVNCVSNRKVPVSLVDPASVPLGQGPRRQRLSRLQPMLLAYLSDEMIKEEVRQEEKEELVGENLDTNSVENREKRAQDAGCHIDDFTVNFHNIDLVYVLAPYEYNARQCIGSCSHSILRHRGSMATNHAKIMASAVALKRYNPQIPFNHNPTEPCCVPTKYESMSLLVVDDITEFNYAVYPAMSVSQCGCR